MTAVVLFSGGMDSTVALYDTIMKNQGTCIHTLTFDYGQRHRAEIQAAVRIIRLAQAKYPVQIQSRVISLLNIMPLVGSLMHLGTAILKYPNQKDLVRDDPAFIPHRNLLFLTIAAQWARHLKANQIVTGLRGGFADCNQNFEFQVEQMLAVSDPSWDIRVTSPVHHSRKETVLLADRIPGCMEALGQSLTCFEGTKPACRQCLPCRKRAEGFRQAGFKDPAL